MTKDDTRVNPTLIPNPSRDYGAMLELEPMSISAQQTCDKCGCSANHLAKSDPSTKATFEFNLDDLDGRRDFELMSKSHELYCAIKDFERELRSRWKYSEEDPKDWHEVKDLFYECLGNVLEGLE